MGISARILLLTLLVWASIAAELPWTADDRAAIEAYAAAARQDGPTWIVERPLVVVRADVDAAFAAERHHEAGWRAYLLAHHEARR